jgi:hypothetical protein
MVALIRERWPDAAVATTDGAVFFSLDERNWPNFATIVWTDAFDEGAPSNLSRMGAYRVNVGVSKETFQRLVGLVTDPDWAAFDRFMPHPVYAKQHWVAVVNPSHGTVRDTLQPLIAEAHDRLAAQRERQHPAR